MSAANIRRYLDTLQGLAEETARTLGSDISFLPPDQRAGNTVSLIALAVLVDALVENGILSEVQLRTAIAGFNTIAWQPEPEPEYDAHTGRKKDKTKGPKT